MKNNIKYSDDCRFFVRYDETEEDLKDIVCDSLEEFKNIENYEIVLVSYYDRQGSTNLRLVLKKDNILYTDYKETDEEWGGELSFHEYGLVIIKELPVLDSIMKEMVYRRYKINKIIKNI